MCEAVWVVADRELRALAKRRAMLDFEEARWIAVAVREGVHGRLGFGSFGEYLGWIFGYGLRLCHEKVRVALALEGLPEISVCLRDGVLNWSAVRVLSRFATAETEAEWIEAVRGLSVHEIERLGVGRKLGDRPEDFRHPSLEEHVFVLRMSPETAALWREATGAVKREAGGQLSEDQVLQTIARTVLEGPSDEGRANYQIVITRCEDCGRKRQRGQGEELDISEHVFHAAECDAQTLEPGKRATQNIPPATRRHVLHRDHGRCAVPGCRNTIFLDIHHATPRNEGGDHHPDRLLTLCGAHHHQTHEGRLLIEGTASTGFIFKHADGTTYGGNLNPKLSAKRSATFQNLLNQGLAHTQAQSQIQT